MAAANVVSHKDLACGSDRHQTLDLYTPEAGADTAGLTVIYVHGGAWQSGGKHLHGGFGAQLAKKGYPAAVVNYRLCPDGWDYKATPAPNMHPAPIVDCKDAIEWLAENSATYRISPVFVLIGHSAGGHMVGHLVLDPELGLSSDIKIAGAIGLEGIFDVALMCEDFPTYAAWFVEKSFGVDRDAWREASPVGVVPSDSARSAVPWLLCHSPTDKLINHAQTAAMEAHLNAIGAPVSLFVDFDRGHDAAVADLNTDPDCALFAAIANFIRGLEEGTGVGADEDVSAGSAVEAEAEAEA